MKTMNDSFVASQKDSVERMSRLEASFVSLKERRPANLSFSATSNVNVSASEVPVKVVQDKVAQVNLAHGNVAPGGANQKITPVDKVVPRGKVSSSAKVVPKKVSPVKVTPVVPDATPDDDLDAYDSASQSGSDVGSRRGSS